MTPAIIDRCGSQGERGIALIVGLVILAVLSLIGIAARLFAHASRETDRGERR